jgi:hypothetical protein
MSINNTDASVSFRDMVFLSIRELGFTDDGCFVLSCSYFPASENAGGYFTAFPISSKEWRDSRGSSMVRAVATKTTFTIYDDYGTPHQITAPRHIIAALAAECPDNGVPLTEAA